MSLPFALAAALLLAQAAPAPKAGPSRAAPEEPRPPTASLKALMKEATRTGLSRDGGSQGLDVGALPFTPDSIRKVVLSFQPQVQACYEELLLTVKDAPPPEGVLRTAFTITAEGSVKAPRVDRKASALKDPRLHDCVQGVLGMMLFPRPPDGQEYPVEFPFNLKAVE